MQILLKKIEHQNATLECLNIADNPGRLGLDRFPATMSRFGKIRKLDISRVITTSSEGPLISPEVMLAWRLEELILTGVSINDKTLDSVSTYLASEMSDSLYLLQMDQCNLTGAHVALLMRSISRKPGEARNMHLHVSANRLEKGNGDIVKAIEASHGPSHLTMRLVDYLTESRFRELLKALRNNTTIRSLDISKASLPRDAGDDTCEALRSLFAENVTLEELDISGEQAHLEIARFGIGLSQALTGLKNNKALKVLRIEYQNLGLEGANALSSVLEQNETLTHIYCDRNDISLQGFTTLVNALGQNFTVLELPFMQDDQAEAVKRMTGSTDDSRSAGASVSEGGVKHSVRRKLTTFGVQTKEKPAPTAQDVEQAAQILTQRWQWQAERLSEFLVRNQRIAAGLDTKERYLANNMPRPATAVSDEGIIEHVLSNTTPKVELSNPVDTAMMSRLDINDEIERHVGSGGATHAAEQSTGRQAQRSRAPTASPRIFELEDREGFEMD